MACWESNIFICIISLLHKKKNKTVPAFKHLQPSTTQLRPWLQKLTHSIEIQGGGKDIEKYTMEERRMNEKHVKDRKMYANYLLLLLAYSI